MKLSNSTSFSTSTFLSFAQSPFSQMPFLKIVLFFATFLFLFSLAACAPRGSEENLDVRRIQVIKGDSSMLEGSYWKALGFYKNAWALSASDLERSEVSVKIYEAYYQGRYWDSCVVWAKQIASTPYYDSLKHKGLVYWRAGYYQKILKLNDASCLLKAEAALRLGADSLAQALYKEAEKKLGGAARGRMAEVYAELDKKDEAIAFLKKIRYPSVKQQELLMKLLFEKEAWNDLPAVIARISSKTKRQSALVRFYDAVGDSAKKRRAQMKLIKIAPASWAAAQAAKQITPRNADEVFALAKALSYSDAKAAIKGFNKAERLGYSRKKCKEARGKLYYRMKEYKKACDNLAILSDISNRFLLVKAMLKLGKTTEAIQILEDIACNASRKKDRQEAWERIATIYQIQGNNLKAAEIAAKGAKELKDRELAHRAVVLWLLEGDSLKAAKAVSGNLPIGKDLSLFYKLYLSLDSPSVFPDTLSADDPFSYYTLLAKGSLLSQPSLDAWFRELGDTLRKLPCKKDSTLQRQAFVLAEAGLFADANRKLGKIKNPPLPVIYDWAERFSELGADNIAIYWTEKLLAKARKKGVKSRPLKLLRLQYPCPYMLTIQEEIDDVALFMALTRQESWFNPLAKSPARAYGLCQLLLSTARGMDTTVTLDSLYKPSISIRLGAEFLRAMRQRFNKRKAAYISAYNAGPGAARRWIEYLPEDDVLFIELIPYNETRNYVRQILRGEIIYRSLLGISE